MTFDRALTRIILFSFGVFFPVFSFSLAAASELDFNLSDEAFLLRYTMPLSDGAQADLGVLHEEDDIYVGSLGFHMVDNAGSETNPLKVGLGGRLVFVDTATVSGGGIALGAFARYNFPGANRFALAGSVHYAPKVVSFSDLENYLEYDFRGEYEVLKNGSVYVGYRRVEADFDIAKNADLDKGLHVGMRFVF